MIYGNNDFGIIFNIKEQDEFGSFTYGYFNIIIRGKELLDNKDESWTINCNIRYIKRTLKDIENYGIPLSHDEKDYLYFTASWSREYWTYLEFECLEKYAPEERKLFEDKIIDNMISSEIPFGIEISEYYELLDSGWKFFLFRTEDSDRLIFSQDAGENIFEERYPAGTIQKTIQSLPDL